MKAVIAKHKIAKNRGESKYKQNWEIEHKEK